MFCFHAWSQKFFRSCWNDWFHKGPNFEVVQPLLILVLGCAKEKKYICSSVKNNLSWWRSSCLSGPEDVLTMPSNKRGRETTCFPISPQLKYPGPRTPRSGHGSLSYSSFQWGRETPYNETRGLREQSRVRFRYGHCIFAETTDR